MFAGCLNKYFDNKNQQNPHYNVTTLEEVINGQLPIRYFQQNSMDLPYASTFDCSITGGAFNGLYILSYDHFKN